MQKLSKLKIDQCCKDLIITGDVVAFYPKIDLKYCSYLYEEYLNIEIDLPNNVMLSKQLELCTPQK